MLLSLAAVTAAQADDAKLFFGYCQDDVAGFQIPKDKICGAEAIRIPAEQTAQWEGNKVWGVSAGFGTGSSKDVTLFLSYDLNAAPFYTEAARVRRFKNWNDYEFDAPVEFEAGRDLYVGYYMNCKSSADYIMASDQKTISNPDASLMAFGGNDAELWGNFTDQEAERGSASVRVIITGSNVPVDQAEIVSVDAPYYVQPGVPFALPLNIRNIGGNKIESLDVEVAVDGGAPQQRTVTMDYGIQPASTATVSVPDLVTDRLAVPCPMEVKITGVNGAEFLAEASGYTACTEKVTYRTFVVEEATATWCQYCPRGLYALNYMRERYEWDGSYLGISVHSDRAQSDAFACHDYYPWLETDLISGLPGCSVNRRAPGRVNPKYYVLEQLYKQYKEPSPYQVTVSADRSGRSLKATAHLTPVRNADNVNYAWTFVITEDHVGPAWQSNYYAYGDPNGDAPGYESKSNPFETYYDDLALSAPDVMGIAGSVPAQLVAGQTYDYTSTLDLAKVTNFDKAWVTALLLDLESGEIVQASRIGVNGQQVGVQTVQAPASDGATRYYDLMGREVAQPSHGVFIKVQDGKAVKVAL